jgi:hypothetical protein
MDVCERLLAQAVQFLVTRADVIAAALGAWIERRRHAERNSSSAGSVSADRERLVRQLAEIEHKRAELLAADGLPPGLLADAVQDLGRRWEELRGRLAALPADTPTVESTEGMDAELLARRISSALVEAEATLTDPAVPMEVRWRILRGLVERVVPKDAEPLPGRKRADHPAAVAVYFRRFLPGVPLMWIMRG